MMCHLHNNSLHLLSNIAAIEGQQRDIAEAHLFDQIDSYI